MFRLVRFSSLDKLEIVEGEGSNACVPNNKYAVGIRPLYLCQNSSNHSFLESKVSIRPESLKLCRSESAVVAAIFELVPLWANVKFQLRL